jgi:hypothetical protein
MEQDESKLNQDSGQPAESAISAVFLRVVTDAEYKARLLADPDEALGEYDLSETQLLMIKSLSAEDLDKLTPENLEEFFAADAAVYTPDEADLLDFEAYDPEDFEELS